MVYISNCEIDAFVTALTELQQILSIFVDLQVKVVVGKVDSKKLHEAHFSKTESIDSYVQRRNVQMEVLQNLVKAQSENTKKSEDTETQATSAVYSSLPSACSLVDTGEQPSLAVQPGTQALPGEDSGPHVSHVSHPLRAGSLKCTEQESAAPVNKTPGVTPFVFDRFTGILKPFEATHENAALNKVSNGFSPEKHTVHKHERNGALNRGPGQNKEKTLGSRRGLVMV
ncbi:nucleolar and spindle-associated protein 1 [Tachysurus ichikawai]